MKKLIFILLVIPVVSGNLFSQGGTNYGTNSGSLGEYNSTFGYYAGNSLGSSGKHNTFIGAYAGQTNISADYNFLLETIPETPTQVGLKIPFLDMELDTVILRGREMFF